LADGIHRRRSGDANDGVGPPATRVLDDSELGGLDACETARRLRSRELDAGEVITAAIERARRLEPRLNAIPHERFEDARRRASRPLAGPLAGVPTFVKSLDDERGMPNDFASRAWRGHVARRTEPFVREMLAAGLVSLGRSAAPETGLSATTEPLAFGPTRNPWSTAHSTGG
jgi:amidase